MVVMWCVRETEMSYEAGESNQGPAGSTKMLILNLESNPAVVGELNL